MAPIQRLNDGFRYTNRSAMREQVTLLQPATNSNPDGSPMPFTVFMQNIWASCKVLSNPTEVNASELVQGQVLWDVRIPYVSGVTSQMQMLGPNNQTWFVISVNDPDQLQVELRFICREINGGGVVSEVDETVCGGTF